MKICVLSDPQWDDPFDPSYYLKDHKWEMHDLHTPHVKDEITNLSKQGFDIFLNMCDGAGDGPLQSTYPGLTAPAWMSYWRWKN